MGIERIFGYKLLSFNVMRKSSRVGSCIVVKQINKTS
jgi:hypothetical protein